MKTLKIILLIFICIAVNACNSTKEVPVTPGLEAEPVPHQKKPNLQPQDGSFIVQPKGTSKVGLNQKKYSEVLAAAEREVVRRQQLSTEADAELTSAINDINTGALNNARLKLKKSVEKYPR
ncbi:MAG: hypothetical protein ACJ0IZ_00160 [Verrucomicrobiales bacterium]